MLNLPTIPANVCAKHGLVFDRVFKAHAPGNTGTIEQAHRYNQFLCPDCKGPKTLKPKGIIERYVPVRTVRVRPDTLPDNWEKEWPILYIHGGFYWFSHPRGKVYRVEELSPTVFFEDKE